MPREFAMTEEDNALLSYKSVEHEDDRMCQFSIRVKMGVEGA
jgi:hypothetical protein